MYYKGLCARRALGWPREMKCLSERWRSNEKMKISYSKCARARHEGVSCRDFVFNKKLGRAISSNISETRNIHFWSIKLYIFIGKLLKTWDFEEKIQTDRKCDFWHSFCLFTTVMQIVNVSLLTQKMQFWAKINFRWELFEPANHCWFQNIRTEGMGKSRICDYPIGFCKIQKFTC